MPVKKFVESRKEMENILREETLGFLGLYRRGESYVVPLTYADAEGRIIFHCARIGRKLDFLKENPQVCFTVARQSGKIVRLPQGGSCRADHDSAICRGTARIAADAEERRQLLDDFNHSLQPNAEGITLAAASTCLAVEIRIEEMTGRRWRKGTRDYWKFRFQP